MNLTSGDLRIIGYKIKLYPTPEQEIEFKKYFGASRFVYNLGIDLQKENRKKYLNNKVKYSCLSYFALERKLSELRKTEEYAWLNDFDSKGLALIMKDVKCAYEKYLNKSAKYPKYKKKKHADQMFAIRSERLRISEDTITLPSIGIVSCDRHNHIEIIGSGNNSVKLVPYKHYYNARVIFDGCDYWLTFSLEISHEEGIEANSCKRFKNNEIWQHKPYSEPIGIDLGCKQKNWIVDSNGNRINRPDCSKEDRQQKKYFKRFMHKKHINDQLYKEKQGKITNSTITKVKREYTKNEEKMLKKYNKALKRITNKKKAVIHEYACSIIQEKPSAVIMENLDVRGMNIKMSDNMTYKHIKNHNKNIKDSMLYTVRTIIERKCEANGIEFILADQEYPSSQLCSRCGSRHKIGTLRTYKCPVCGLELDRDLNAAYNLKDYYNIAFDNYIMA